MLQITERQGVAQVVRPARGEAGLRVLFMSDHLGYAGGAIHGATSYFLTVLPALSLKVDLTVCFLRERHAAAAQLAAHGVEPIFLERERSDPRALFDLIRLMRRRRFDIVHAAGMKGILLGRIAAAIGGRQGPKSIIHLHDLRPPGLVQGAVQRALAARTDAALAVSDAVAECARDDFGIPTDRVRVIHNPLPVERFAQPPEAAALARARIRSEFDIEAELPVIGMIGRFSREKGHEALLRAMPGVLKRVPRVVLLAAGEGPLRCECERLAAQLGLSHAVRFVGHRSDIPDVLAAVDVVAMPSMSEGFPYVALEAMAARRPVVAFAVGGLPEIVRDGRNGLLVPGGDIEALSRSLTRVLRDAKLAAQLIAGGSEGIQHLTADAHVAQLVELYEEVMIRSSASRKERAVGTA